MSFWDVVWFIFITYVFVAYLMLLFSIIGDLLRDRETSGIAKAAWFLALIVLPFPLSDFHTVQLATVGAYFIAILGLDILTGHSGQISLGHGAFFALGGNDDENADGSEAPITTAAPSGDATTTAPGTDPSAPETTAPNPESTDPTDEPDAGVEPNGSGSGEADVEPCSADAAELQQIVRAHPPLAQFADRLVVSDVKCAGNWSTAVVSAEDTDSALACSVSTSRWPRPATATALTSSGSTKPRPSSTAQARASSSRLSSTSRNLPFNSSNNNNHICSRNRLNFRNLTPFPSPLQ